MGIGKSACAFAEAEVFVEVFTDCQVGQTTPMFVVLPAFGVTWAYIGAVIQVSAMVQTLFCST